ncbi:M20 metallopeptidase family protein [Pseudonocardia spinosispora]|uniref:M20 metallopeptidase family protein n=1 Tax=Pseudonocardia spinosispora TaxID=103441 RepID=UPI00048F8F04|nr:M20 family metallopeptidase [Pseudonocardia spinosispora]
MTDLFDELTAQLAAAHALRRRLHASPDVSGDESATRETVLSALPAGVGSAGVAGTGAVVRIGGPGPAVGLRAELDALEVTETTGIEWASRRTGLMHACGHDVHLAAAVAVARAVHAVGGPAPLLLVLQPREESYPSGARDVVESGALAVHGCAAMIGAHVQPVLAPDVVACVPGGVNASSDEFELLVTGEPGHAAYPHLARDPVHALAQIVVAVQSIVSRNLDPMSPAVVGVSSLRAGAAANVVPGTAHASGTIRALSPETRLLLHQRVTEVAEGVARAHGCEAKVSVTHGEPVLTNDPALAELAAGQLRRRGLTVCETLRSAGADDFSYYGEQVPSLMLFVGTDTDVPLHSDTFLPTESDLARVATTMLAAYLAAADHLTNPAPTR